MTLPEKRNWFDKHQKKIFVIAFCSFVVIPVTVISFYHEKQFQIEDCEGYFIQPTMMELSDEQILKLNEYWIQSKCWEVYPDLRNLPSAEGLLKQ